MIFSCIFPVSESGSSLKDIIHNMRVQQQHESKPEAEDILDRIDMLIQVYRASHPKHQLEDIEN